MQEHAYRVASLPEGLIQLEETIKKLLVALQGDESHQ